MHYFSWFVYSVWPDTLLCVYVLLLFLIIVLNKSSKSVLVCDQHSWREEEETTSKNQDRDTETFRFPDRFACSLQLASKSQPTTTCVNAQKYNKTRWNENQVVRVLLRCHHCQHLHPYPASSGKTSSFFSSQHPRAFLLFLISANVLLLCFCIYQTQIGRAWLKNCLTIESLNGSWTWNMFLVLSSIVVRQEVCGHPYHYNYHYNVHNECNMTFISMLLWLDQVCIFA